MMNAAMLKWKTETTKHCNFPISKFWNTYMYITKQPYSYVLSILNTQWFPSHHHRSVAVQEMSVLLVTFTMHTAKYLILKKKEN